MYTYLCTCICIYLHVCVSIHMYMYVYRKYIYISIIDKWLTNKEDNIAKHEGYQSPTAGPFLMDMTPMDTFSRYMRHLIHELSMSSRWISPLWSIKPMDNPDEPADWGPIVVNISPLRPQSLGWSSYSHYCIMKSDPVRNLDGHQVSGTGRNWFLTKVSVMISTISIQHPTIWSTFA